VADEERAEALFVAQYPGLVRQLTHLLGDRSAAEDVAQEAFLRVLRRPPRQWADAGPWLAVIGRRLAFNHLRGERRRRERERRLADDPAMGPAEPDPGAGEDAALLREALARLRPRDRVALLLRAAGCDYAAVAVAIGVRPSSVGTILARASRLLKADYLAAASGPSPVRPEGGLRPHDALP